MLIKGETSETITLRNDRLFQRRRYQGKTLASTDTHLTLKTEVWHCTQRNEKKGRERNKRGEVIHCPSFYLLAAKVPARKIRPLDRFRLTNGYNTFNFLFRSFPVMGTSMRKNLELPFDLVGKLRQVPLERTVRASDPLGSHHPGRGSSPQRRRAGAPCSGPRTTRRIRGAQNHRWTSNPRDWDGQDAARVGQWFPSS